MHQFTLNFIALWHLCHLSPKILILSGVHKIHICFLQQDIQQPEGGKKKPLMSQALETAKHLVLLLLVFSLPETLGHIIYFRFC